MSEPRAGRPLYCQEAGRTPTAGGSVRTTFAPGQKEPMREEKERAKPALLALLRRRGRPVEALDLGIGVGPQLLHVIGLRLPGREFLDLSPDSLERRRLAHALVFDLE